MIVNLFSFPTLITKINSNNFDKKKIIRDIEYNYKIDVNRNKWDTKNSNLHHSNKDLNNKKFKDINYKTLIPLYKNDIELYLNNLKFSQKIKYNFKIVNYTCMKSNQNMQSHYHDGADFTAVHYLKFDKEEHKPTVFENKNTYAGYLKYLRPELLNLLDSSDPNNSWVMDYWNFNIEENCFCITPSFLHHYVPIQTSDKTRITIVLNIYLSKE